jgi:hypothetical protein
LHLNFTRPDFSAALAGRLARFIDGLLLLSQTE